MSQSDKQSTTNHLATRQGLGVARALSQCRLHKLNYQKLIGSNMKILEKICCYVFVALATSLCLVALYYYVKAIVGFDN
jgi:hypothetical protein